MGTVGHHALPRVGINGILNLEDTHRINNRRLERIALTDCIESLAHHALHALIVRNILAELDALSRVNFNQRFAIATVLLKNRSLCTDKPKK